MADSTAIQDLLNAECDSFVAAVDHFRAFVPSPRNKGSASPGEEGRYVEAIVVEWLRRSLPERLEVGTGFVVDASRGQRSYQVDVLVWDRLSYTPHLRYGEAVVIPPQAVVAAISVKKNLQASDIEPEARNLAIIGSMCGGNGDASPYLSLFGLDTDLTSNSATAVRTVFSKISDAYPSRLQKYSANELIDAVIVLNRFLVIKKQWRGRKNEMPRSEAKYLWTGGDGQHRNIYLQHLLHGIESVLNGTRALAGPTARMRDFPDMGMQIIGTLPICTEDRPPQSEPKTSASAPARQQ